MLRINTNYPTMYENIITETSKYVQEHKIKTLVLGMSGGIDSTLTAAIASAVCKINNITLIGLSMPIISNADDEIHRAELAGRVFCDYFEEVVRLDDLYDIFYSTIASQSRIDDEAKAEKIRRGNMKARIRMITLYDTAHLNNGIVLSTDNYTELMLGFWTLAGDIGDFGMLQNLWKTEVYGLAKWMAVNFSLASDTESRIKCEALNACIDAVPTDGLGISSSDFEQLGVNSYEEVDKILFDYLTNGVGSVDNPIIRRYEGTHFKRNNPVNIPREIILKEMS